MKRNNSNKKSQNNMVLKTKDSVDVYPINHTQAALSIPFDVTKDLNKYDKVYISKETDVFRTVHLFETCFKEYRVFVDNPEGDKTVLFTVRHHYQFCNCCNDFHVDCCCFTYMCCDRIVTQLDYKRNNINFYTQGINIQKGCYVCYCYCSCCVCCPPTILYLRENMDPDNPDFDVGVKKGTTREQKCCFLSDRTSTYFSEQGVQGYGIRLNYCEMLKYWATCCICGLFDIEIDIEDEKGEKVGNIIVPNGLCSKKTESGICYKPRSYYEINFPKKASSFEKFQLIADIIHFDYENMVLI
jgi:hypothetical protein